MLSRLFSYLKIRRLKDDVLSELPPKHRHALYLEAGVEETNLLQKRPDIVNKLQKVCEAGGDITPDESVMLQVYRSQKWRIVNRFRDLEQTKPRCWNYSKIQGRRSSQGSLSSCKLSQKNDQRQRYQISFYGHLQLQILCFGHHKFVLNGLCDAFNPSSYICIDGSVNASDRHSIVTKFQTDSR